MTELPVKVACYEGIHFAGCLSAWLSSTKPLPAKMQSQDLRLFGLDINSRKETVNSVSLSKLLLHALCVFVRQ